MKIVEKNRNDKKVKPKLGKESELWARLTPKFKIISKFSLQNFNITISVLHDSTDILTVKYNQNWQFKRKQNFLNSVRLKWIFLPPPPFNVKLLNLLLFISFFVMFNSFCFLFLLQYLYNSYHLVHLLPCTHVHLFHRKVKMT